MKSNNSILFSVIIPTYNRAKFIPTAINSVLQQSYKNFELIIVDDGSTDNTEEIVKNFTDPRIKYYKIPNSERGAARNYGTSVSKGHYVNFFDSDDLLYNNHLEEANRIIIEKKHSWFNLSYDVKDENGKLIEIVNYKNINVGKKIIKNGNILSCNSVFLRSDIAKNNMFSEIRELSGSEDYELWLRLIAKFPLTSYNTVTSTVINHTNRSVLTMKKDKLIKRMDHFLNSIENNSEFMQQHRNSYKIIQSNTYSYIALHLALSKDDRIESIKYLLQSIVKNPKSLFNKRFAAIIKHLI